jgi:Domain of unknown function (DUF4145)
MSPLLSTNLDIPRCPHCNVDSPNLPHVANLETTSCDNDNRRVWRVYRCMRCGGLTTAAAYDYDLPVLEMFPSSQEVDETIPARARAYLDQAINSLSSPAGAVMLAASSVDAMLKAKGMKEGSLYKRIDKAVSEHLITPDMAKWAHEVRLDANDQRHADDAAPLPTAKDAKRAVDFAMALGTFMFVLPSLVERGIADAESD